MIDKPLIDCPLCDCVKSIESKYIAIASEAIEKGKDPNGKTFLSNFDPSELNKAKESYKADYLIEVKAVIHDCPQMEKIRFMLENDSKYWESEKQDLDNETYIETLELRKSELISQSSKYLEKIKISTSNLTTINSFEYWVYYFSRLSLKQKSELIKTEHKNKLNEDILSEKITHKNSVVIVEKIKTQYKNIKGKRLKLLLIALQELNLLPMEKIASSFHRCCKKEFDWEIASYEAMNNYNYNINVDEQELETMKGYISSLLNTE